MGMYKKLLISTSLLACVLGAGVVSSVAADAQYIQQANIAGYNAKAAADLDYPGVTESTTHNIKVRGSYPDSQINKAPWEFSKLITDADTGENSLYVTLDPSELGAAPGNDSATEQIIFTSNVNGTPQNFNISEIMEQGQYYYTETKMSAYGSFMSPLAVMKNNGRYYYGYFGYVDQTTGEFHKCPLYSMAWLDNLEQFDFEGDQKIAFRFDGIDFTETSDDVELLFVDGMINLDTQGSAYGDQWDFNDVLGGRDVSQGYQTWEELIAVDKLANVETYAIASANDSLNNQKLEVDIVLDDPILPGSFVVDNVQHETADVQFDAYISDTPFLYQEFDHGEIGSVNQNIDFYYGPTDTHIDATLLGTIDSEYKTDDIRTYKYELALQPDVIYSDMSVDITFENDDGISTPAGNTIPKTRTYEVLSDTEQITPRYDNPFDLSSSTTKWNDDKGQILAHIALNKGSQYLPLDPSTQSIDFKYYDSKTGASGTFGKGTASSYKTNFTVSSDGTYADLIITNPNDNEFLDLTNISAVIDTQPSNPENEMYEFSLKDYSDPVGQTTPINSIVDSSLNSGVVTFTFDVDPVNNSVAETEAALEDLNLTFGYDGVYSDDELKIDSNAQPINPTTGSEFESSNDFVVTQSGEDYLATIELTTDSTETLFTDFWMQTDGVFRIYDKTGTTISDDKVNPIISNSGEITNLTGTSATLSFLVNDDGDENKYANYDATSAVFTASADTDLSGVTYEYVTTETEALAAGQAKIIYNISGLTQGQTYKNIKVEMEYTDGFVSDGPRQILSSFTTLKENPIVEGSGTLISTTESTAKISFEVYNEVAGEDKYGDYILTKASFDGDGFTGSEGQLYNSIVEGTDTSTITYTLINLDPNTEYSNITVDFDYSDGYSSDPVQIFSTPITTDRINPIIKESGEIVDIGSDYVELKFRAYKNPASGHEDYANYDINSAVFTGTGLDGDETVSVIGTPAILSGSQEITYRISGLNPGSDLSNIYVNFTFEDGFTDSPTLILKDKITTEKLNPIVANSGVVSNITETSATLSFKYNEEVAGSDIYPEFSHKVVQFKYDGQTTGPDSTETSKFVSDVSNGDGTATLTFDIDGLDSNKTYNNVSAELYYTESFESDGPTIILNEFTTKRTNPIIADSGLVVGVTETDATISFNVHEDALGKDMYANYDANDVTFTDDQADTWTDNVTFINKVGLGNNISKLTYKISGLSPNKSYTNIKVELGYEDGEKYDPTHILNVVTTDNISKDPIVVSSFKQDDSNTTISSAQFSFDYRIDYLPEDPVVTSIGYTTGLNEYVEFDNYTFIKAEAHDEERGTATYRIDNLETNFVYYDIWLTLNNGEKVFAIDEATGSEFDIRTKGLEPIIEDSGEITDVTDTTAKISYEYYSNTKNGLVDKNGNYYEFDPADVTIGYIEETTGVEVPFINVEYTGSKNIETVDGVTTKRASYNVTKLNFATTYKNIYVQAHTSDENERLELEQTIISETGFTTLGQNPLLSDSIKITNVVPSDGTEAELSFWFQGMSAVYDEEDGASAYTQIDTKKTLVGYDSSIQTESDGTRIGKNGGTFNVEWIEDNTINGVFTEATYKLTDLEANTTYTGIYVIAYDAEGNQLSKTYATGDNATFTALPSDALPMTPGEVIMWISIIILVVLLLIIIIYIAIKFIKKHFALAIFMDSELSIDESEIVFNLINVKHKKKLWQAFEGNLVLYAAGKKIDAIFKRTTELHNGYRVYIAEDFTDKEAMFSLLTSTKYNKFSVGIYKDHSRYHVASVPDRKVSRLAARLDHTDDREYEDVVHSIVENLDHEHIEEKLFDSIEGFISGINKRKTTSTSLRYQAIVPHDHSLNHDLFFEENDVSFWHVYDGKLYELKYEFVNRFGSLIEVDIIGLKPGTAYVGLTLSFDKGKTFMPSATVYGITRDEEGKMPNLTNAELAKKPTASAKGVQIWDEQTLVANVGERLAELHKKVITKMHFEDNEENSTKIISLEKSTNYFGDYINKWWSESKVEKPKTSSKTTETKVSTKEAKETKTKTDSKAKK